jgi:gliding motility-associated-like protein
MIENNSHIDPFFDAFKDALNDYQPDFNADDLKADWSGVKSQINPSHSISTKNTDISKGFKSLLNLKNIIITSVTGVAVIATTVAVLNNKKESSKDISKPENTISQQLVNTENTNTDPTVQIEKQQNAISYNNAVKENNFVQDINKSNSSVTAGQNITATDNYSSNINNIPKPLNIPDQTKSDPPVNQNTPKIIITQNGFPKQDEVYLSDTQFCQNQVVKLSYNFKDPGYQRIYVSMQGKPLEEYNRNFTYRFVKPGWYNLNLTIQNYSTTITKSYRINVFSSPVAAFSLSMNESPMIKFYNQSKYADNYRWQFGDNSSGTYDNPYHRYMDTGTYKVLLIAATDGVCSDTTVKLIHVQKFNQPEIPNTFSPNNDGINDEFYIRIDNLESYQLSIFDRSSNMVFSSRDKNEKWNGNNKDNKQCPAGTYFFFLNYKMVGQDQPVDKSGTITLFR